MIKNKDTMEASANNVSSAILTGSPKNKKAGTYVLNDILYKGDASSVQGIIDNSGEGEQALYSHLKDIMMNMLKMKDLQYKILNHIKKILCFAKYK